MEEYEDNSFKTSKYNSALAQLYRIGELWKDAHRHKRDGSYSKWNADLDAIWSELAGDLKEGDQRESKYNSFTKQLSQVGSIARPVMSGFSKPDENYYQKIAKQYGILLQKEIWLRRLQNEQGKGTSYADEFEDDFD